MAEKEPSNLWADVTERQRDMRVAFFQQQHKKSESARKGANAGNDERRGLMIRQSASRAELPGLAKNVESKLRLTEAMARTTSSQWKTELVFQFVVSAPGLGVIMGDFRRVSGLGTGEWEFETYHEGGDNGPEHILPSRMKNGRLVLEWALRHPDPFVLWCISMGTGVMLYQPITVTLLDGRTPRAMWEIPQCLIAKIEGPVLDALGREVATTKIELIHNGIISI